MARGLAREANGKAKSLDPGLRRGDESCPNAAPETEALHAAGNGEAEPAVAFSFCSAGRGWSEGTGKSRRCGRGRFFASFLCRHK
ncbi:MAG: hypothetical protein KDG53_16410, partial [Rhodocyclaceae bacterium]|nr:hypothetical protein [Rhodocyclaceae bacterium]